MEVPSVAGSNAGSSPPLQAAVPRRPPPPLFMDGAAAARDGLFTPPNPDAPVPDHIFRYEIARPLPKPAASPARRPA